MPSPPASGRTPGRDGGPTPASGRYLEAMYYILHEGELVRPGRLAEWLGVSAPSVSEAVRRLARDGLVEVGPERTVVFTPTGLRVAGEVVRRHRIAEVWLSRDLGLDWVAADEEAQRLAPALSDRVLDRLYEQLGRPATCPHGNTIPGAAPRQTELVSLAELPVGTTATVARISEVAEHDAPQLLTLLWEARLVPGSAVRVLELAPASGAVVVAVDGRRTALALPEAGAVWVSAPVGPQAGG